jgi:hypothetical protein
MKRFGRLILRGGCPIGGRRPFQASVVTEPVTGTFTFNVRRTLSDGSTFSNHVVGHFNERPDGTVHEFFRCH